MSHEKKKAKILTQLKHIYLRLIFLFIDHFLYIGSENKLFYKYLGIQENKLLFCPYSVDNERFRSVFHSINKSDARKTLNLPIHKKIILYSGKYIEKKRPLDLLEAFNKLGINDSILIFVGDGELKDEMQQRILKYNLTDRVILTGFINQNEIPLSACQRHVSRRLPPAHPACFRLPA